MEIFYYVIALVSFVACVYAYLLGVKHGMKVSSKTVPRPLHEALKPIEKALKKETIEEPISTIMSWNYEEALKAVKKEREA